MGILRGVERARRPRGGKDKEKGDGAAGADPSETVGGNVVEGGGTKTGGASAAAAAAIDAIEQVVMGLANGKEEVADVPPPIVDASATAAGVAPTAATAAPNSPPPDRANQTQKAGKGGKQRLDPTTKRKLDDLENNNINTIDAEISEENPTGK